MMFFEIVRDCGQKNIYISVRWVITKKVKGGHILTKARLVARGFEENTSDIKKKKNLQNVQEKQYVS